MENRHFKELKKNHQCLLIGLLMEELNKSTVDVPLSCGGSELPQHVLCLAKHRTGNSAGQIGCLSPANSYWQKETNSHFYSHPQAFSSFFHLTCVSLDCGRKTTGAPGNTFRQTENTQTPREDKLWQESLWNVSSYPASLLYFCIRIISWSSSGW